MGVSKSEEEWVEERKSGGGNYPPQYLIVKMVDISICLIKVVPFGFKLRQEKREGWLFGKYTRFSTKYLVNILMNKKFMLYNTMSRFIHLASVTDSIYTFRLRTTEPTPSWQYSTFVIRQANLSLTLYQTYLNPIHYAFFLRWNIFTEAREL